MLLFFLFWCSLSWCPFLHQNIAEHFADEQFPDISAKQRHAFILGAVYADGYDKKITHLNVPLFKTISKISNKQQDNSLFWFLKGVFCHIIADTFAHAGKTRSFIASRGIRHHLSEVLIDNFIFNNYNKVYPKYKVKTNFDETKNLNLGFSHYKKQNNCSNNSLLLKDVMTPMKTTVHELKYLELTDEIRNGIKNIGMKEKKIFPFYYKMIYITSKYLPFLHKLLIPYLQNDKSCNNYYRFGEFLGKESGIDISIKHFMKHYNAIFKALRLSFRHIGDANFTNIRLQEWTTLIVLGIKCNK